MSSSIKNILEEALLSTDLSVEKATEIVFEQVKDLPPSYEDFFAPLLKHGIRSEAYALVRRHNHSCWTGEGRSLFNRPSDDKAGGISEIPCSTPKGVSGETLEKSPEGDRWLGKEERKDYLNMTLNKVGIKMKFATSEHLYEQAMVHASHAASNGCKASFFYDVANKLMPQEQVLDRFTNEDLIQLAKQKNMLFECAAL